MSLENFLGKTSEIRIIDFLSKNSDINYNQSEISECTGLSRTTVNQKMPYLIYNGIVDIKDNLGNVNYYQLKDSKIVKGLIGAVFANSFFIAEHEGDSAEIIDSIKLDVGPVKYEALNCFCYSDEESTYVIENTEYEDKNKWPMLPISIFSSDELDTPVSA
jgi:DNA-binding transcriptional ArsR family regulator